MLTEEAYRCSSQPIIFVQFPSACSLDYLLALSNSVEREFVPPVVLFGLID
jgi:hypothetical protein